MRALLDAPREEDESFLEFDSREVCAKAQTNRFPHRTANGWISSTVARLRRDSRSARKRGDYKEAQALGFAAQMLIDLKRYGRPGLYVGMFYDDDWEWIGYRSEREANPQ
ncbi:MAG: hypothetical protein DMG44_14455 [Acidobacteria bacterium]|nr:MAG: hypothetical protein DMG44_14455 [Acidobacteriota bacterium]